MQREVFPVLSALFLLSVAFSFPFFSPVFPSPFAEPPCYVGHWESRGVYTMGPVRGCILEDVFLGEPDATANYGRTDGHVMTPRDGLDSQEDFRKGELLKLRLDG